LAEQGLLGIVLLVDEGKFGDAEWYEQAFLLHWRQLAEP